MTNRLLESLIVTLTGLCIVFAGLILLICLIKLLTMATAKIGAKKAKKNEPAAVVAETAPTAEETEEVTDDALIAVISAAVACMMDEKTGFTVRHIRRINNAPAWAKSGRDEQIYSHY